MKHTKQELTYKKFIKAEKRLNEIYKEIRELPYVELKEPYQSGWELIPVLREDYLRSEKGPIVKILIDTFGVKSYTRNSKIISQIRKNPSLNSSRKIVGKNSRWGGAPYIRNITKKEYLDLSNHFKKYFDELSPLAKQYKKGDYEINIPTHYIVIKIKKNIITHKKDINPSLLKEQAELKKILEPYYRTFRYGEGYYHYFEKRAERRKAKMELTKLELE